MEDPCEVEEVEEINEVKEKKLSGATGRE